MPAVLEADEIVSPPPVTVPPPRDYSHLKAYQFKPGQHVQGSGRPKGSKSFAKVLSVAAPKLAKAYVVNALKGNATILTDARKVFVPIDEDVASSDTKVVIFFGAGDLPRTLIPVAEDRTASLPTPVALPHA